MVFFVMMVIKGMSYALNNPTKEILYQVHFTINFYFFLISFDFISMDILLFLLFSFILIFICLDTHATSTSVFIHRHHIQFS